MKAEGEGIEVTICDPSANPHMAQVLQIERSARPRPASRVRRQSRRFRPARRPRIRSSGGWRCRTSARARGPASINMRPMSTTSHRTRQAANSRLRRCCSGNVAPHEDTLLGTSPTSECATTTVGMPRVAAETDGRGRSRPGAPGRDRHRRHSQSSRKTVVPSRRFRLYDDHPIVITGCKALLAAEPAIEVLEAADCREGGYSVSSAARPMSR